MFRFSVQEGLWVGESSTPRFPFASLLVLVMLRSRNFGCVWPAVSELAVVICRAEHVVEKAAHHQGAVDTNRSLASVFCGTEVVRWGI